jgi:nitrogen regulatory protein P-II 1
MKEIKAFIHRNRISDVVLALKHEGYQYISVVDVLGLMKALGAQAQQYSVDLGTKVVSEIKLELVCEDDQLDKAVDLIEQNAKTGDDVAGWIYVTAIEKSVKIGGSL